MTYREIIKEIEHYEKKCNSAFQVYGDHKKTKVKRDMFVRAKNEKDIALSAIYDFCDIYRFALEDEFVKESLDLHLSELEDNGEVDEETAKLNQIYLKILEACLALESKDRLRILKYGMEKKEQHRRKDIKDMIRRNKNIVANLTDRINYDFKKYTSDKRKRENVVFHVGTLQSEIDAFVSKLSLEEVEYNLLISAIKDSLGISTQNVLISEGLIKNSFDEIDVFPKDSSSYVDDSAFELSTNGYETYKSTFIDVYQLDSRYKNRLCKKIGGKLK